MVVIIPENKSVENYKGLHLYHGDISNCSMRVRMTLIEKGLDWTSHHIDLKKKENITDDYFGINPNGLVPTLIDDGVVHIESNDIIDYLDEKYPEPSLRSKDNEAEMLEWLRLAGSIHVPAVKPYVYANKIAAKIKKTSEEEQKYDALQNNQELKNFHEKHKGNKQFSDEDLAKSEQILKECYGENLGTQFKYHNCIFDFINISTNNCSLVILVLILKIVVTFWSMIILNHL